MGKPNRDVQASCSTNDIKIRRRQYNHCCKSRRTRCYQIKNLEYADLLSPCSHEEADTSMLLHARHASKTGHENVTIRSNDTDGLVLAVHFFKHLGIIQLCVASGSGSNFRYLPVHLHGIYKSISHKRQFFFIFWMRFLVQRFKFR